ncbi:hypothetical protein [Mesorhizobium sp. M00.F.Ca.ET.216.01.1.1]|uniref:hypothetical protein n=1 Tax=Mesorhizobium sp. M00.F.Ca.ET.216.01.1.1 TaxID=2500528 RepID=UPI000FDCBC2E|nr:hypothetical protein [Mesorhizobium sp. M00.F.Ca.ET.216.01.1.1]TGQ32778.1 hypothetical protein EN859_027885 [Mesorhizobium sp. M00.F.Ca.ET.216.01.1.1]TJW39933.1 MAG: hypothetical protein E5W83_29785 [Mesorhizobium sp.]
MTNLSFISSPRLLRHESTGKPPIINTTEQRAALRARLGAKKQEEQRRMDACRPRPASANDNVDPRWRGNLPVLKAIAEVEPGAALAIRAGGRAPTREIYGEEDGFEVAEDGEKIRLRGERLHKVRPTIEMMFGDLLRVRVITNKAAAGAPRVIEYRHTGPSTPVRKIGDDVLGLGDMRFNYHGKAKRSPAGGLMVSYVDQSGKERAPFYDASAKRGGGEDYDAGRVSGGKAGVRRPACLPQEPERPDLSEASANVLEMILAGFHWKDIGMALGYSNHYADRGAKQHVWAAAAEAKAKVPTADNDNVENFEAAA